MWWRLGISHDTAFSAVIAVIGLASLGLGGVLSYQTQFRHPRYRYIPASEEWQSYLDQLINQANQESAPVSSSESAFLVDVSGAVAKPGVYAVSESSRLQDAILMAGGFAPEADQRFIHQDINLASRLQDQQKIYIPLEGEVVTPGQIVSGTPEQTSNPNGKLSLRVATKQDLESLEGIGEKRAESILAGYPYRDEDDFLERSGLSRNMALELLDTSISIE